MIKYLVLSFSFLSLVCAGRTDIPNENDLYKPYISERENSLVDMDYISHLFNDGDSVQLYSLFDTLFMINCDLYTKIPGYISGTYLSFEIENDITPFTVIMVDRDSNFVNLFLNAILPVGKYTILDVPNTDYNGKKLSWTNIGSYFQYIRRGLDYRIYLVSPSWISRYIGHR